MKPKLTKPLQKNAKRKTKKAAAARRVDIVPVAMAAAIALTGFAVWLRLSDVAKPALARMDDAAFAREIDRAVAEGGTPGIGVPLFPVPVQAASTLPRRQNRAAREGRGIDTAAAASTNELIAEARKYLGRNPTGWSSEWCGRFLDMILKKTGHKGGGNLARGYINYGTRVAGPQVGAIAVFSRKGGGHVGIVTGVDSNGNPIVISGNYNDRVAIATYPSSRVLAYVRP